MTIVAYIVNTDSIVYNVYIYFWYSYTNSIVNIEIFCMYVVCCSFFLILLPYILVPYY